MSKQVEQLLNKKNKIALLDCNNFFVSCERLFRPDLIKKPVLVLSGNDGCVVARSKEVKDIGIPMGVPYFQIKDIIKDNKITAFSSNFALYRDISRRVFEVVKNEIDDIEQYSIDECFFNLDGNEEVVFNLKDKIENSVGIPISIGVASTKTQAKYVGSVAKKSKSGIEIWSDKKWFTEISKIKLSELWGVGQGKVRIFNDYGLLTVENLISMPERQVNNLFGIFGVRLQSELAGNPVFPVKTKRPIQKSVLSSRSFSGATDDIRLLKEAVKYHVYKCTKDLNSMKLATKTLRVSIGPSRYSKFFMKNASLEIVFPEPVDDLFTLTEEAIKLLNTMFEQAVPYKKAGVSMSNLVDVNAKTDSLFCLNDNLETKTELSKLLFSINSKIGRETLKLGSLRTEIGTIWLSKKDSISPAYTTSWSQLREVR